MGSKDLCAAALASVVARSGCPFLSPSAIRPDLAVKKLARTKVNEQWGSDVVETIKKWGTGMEVTLR